MDITKPICENILEKDNKNKYIDVSVGVSVTHLHPFDVILDIFESQLGNFGHL